MKTAVFEVDFDVEDIIDKEELEKQFNNDLLECMQELYNNDGFGLFDNDIKLVEIKDGKNE